MRIAQERKIERAGAEVAHQHLRFIAAEADLFVDRSRGAGPDHLDDAAIAEPSRHADHDLARTGIWPDDGDELIVHPENAARVAQGDGAPPGEAQSRALLEQLPAQDDSQTGDLRADRGLRQVEKLGRTRVAAA